MARVRDTSDYIAMELQDDFVSDGIEIVDDEEDNVDLSGIQDATPPASYSDVRSPTRTEVRSPTRTSTRANTRGNRTKTSTDGSYNTTTNNYTGSAQMRPNVINKPLTEKHRAKGIKKLVIQTNDGKIIKFS